MYKMKCITDFPQKVNKISTRSNTASTELKSTVKLINAFYYARYSIGSNLKCSVGTK